jgi:hypothetical protein
VDNIAPSVPQGLEFAGPAILSWDQPAAGDFAFSSVFGSAHAQFDEAAVLIGHTILTSFDVSASPHAFYHVTATDDAGNRSGAASIASPTANAEVEGSLPTEFALLPVRPNPARGAVEITFDLPLAGDVTMGVYGISGRRVRTLQAGVRPAGSHRLIWDGTDGTGHRVPGGVYFVRLQSGSFDASRRLLLVD